MFASRVRPPALGCADAREKSARGSTREDDGEPCDAHSAHCCKRSGRGGVASRGLTCRIHFWAHIPPFRREDFALVRSGSTAAAPVRSQRRRLRARPAIHVVAAPRCCSATSPGRNQRRERSLAQSRAFRKSTGRELDPRFYCSLGSVKVVSPAFARRSPPLTVLARIGRVSIDSRRRVVAVGRRKLTAFS